MGNIAEDEPLGFSINNRKSAIGNQKFPQPFRRIEMSSANRLFVHHIQCFACLTCCENRGIEGMLPVEIIVRKCLITSQLSIPKLNRFNLPVDRRGPRAAPQGPPGLRSLNSGQQNASTGHSTCRAGRFFVTVDCIARFSGASVRIASWVGVIPTARVFTSGPRHLP